MDDFPTGTRTIFDPYTRQSYQEAIPFEYGTRFALAYWKAVQVSKVTMDEN